MKINQGEKIKLKVEIVVEVTSDEYTNSDTIIDEFSNECTIIIEGTDTIEVHNVEFEDCQLT